MKRETMRTCPTCGQVLATRDAMVRKHVATLTMILDEIEAGRWFVEDFPQLRELARMIALSA